MKTTFKAILLSGTFFVVLMLCCFVGQAQFIRLTLNIPAGVELNPNPVPPQILEPPVKEKGGFGYRSSLNPGTRWIELRAKENINFAVQFTPNVRRPGGFKPMLYLNDGTTNFAAAMQLNSGMNELRMYNEPIMIKNIPGDLTTLSSWLGMPANASGTLTIIYL
ncbi:MAG: hypothetical protein Q8J69_03175 [Sphingobacteriaceae bacterium]|nr:hypothetical protein [Sphingobacteriaceae bacterium]